MKRGSCSNNNHHISRDQFHIFQRSIKQLLPTTATIGKSPIRRRGDLSARKSIIIRSIRLDDHACSSGTLLKRKSIQWYSICQYESTMHITHKRHQWGQSTQERCRAQSTREHEFLGRDRARNECGVLFHALRFALTHSVLVSALAVGIWR